jgi:hypothetical protein
MVFDYTTSDYRKFVYVNAFENGDVSAVLEKDGGMYLQHISNSPRQGVSDNRATAPVSFDLLGIAPNPFNSMTRLKYRLEESATIKLSVFDLQGRTVHVASFFRGTGEGNIALDMRAFATGLYFARLEAAGSVVTRSLLLLK